MQFIGLSLLLAFRLNINFIVVRMFIGVSMVHTNEGKELNKDAMLRGVR